MRTTVDEIIDGRVFAFVNPVIDRPGVPDFRSFHQRKRWSRIMAGV